VRASQSVNDMVRRLCGQCIRVCVFAASVCVLLHLCVCCFGVYPQLQYSAFTPPPVPPSPHTHTLHTGLEWESLGELHRTSHGHLKITFPDDILVRTQYWDAVTMLGHGPIVRWPQLDSDGVYVYIYIYMYVCIHVYIYICMCICIYTCIYGHVPIVQWPQLDSDGVYVYIYIYIYVCIHVYIYICMCICIYTCIYCQGPIVQWPQLDSDGVYVYI